MDSGLSSAALPWVFWGSSLAVAYAYAGYPVAIGTLAAILGTDRRPPTVDHERLPRVTLIIAAHNEASVIAERLGNALELNYPTDRLEIIVASDGSDDGTVEICSAFAPRVRTLAFETRRGKAGALNAALREVANHGDDTIVVFSDANTMMERDSLLRLVRWFAEPDVGVVCGRLILEEATSGRNADGAYWRYETFLKRCEGRLGGLLGANGAIYAMRRSLVTPLPLGTVVDDFVLPLLAKIASDCRIIYDSEAIAFEETAPSVGGEFRRRARIGVGGFQALWILRRLLNPLRGWTAFTFWSHKVLRWLCPFCMVAALASSAALAADEPYRTAFLVQVLFYGTACMLAALPERWWLTRRMRIVPMFVWMNAALLVGFVRFVRGGHRGVWKRTARVSES
jgi:cellulose synthase/poly-beta-1,6-N-acetylglucosamine synthase-like glycosyltransferase